MYQPQNSLPTPKNNRFPEFNTVQAAKVTSIKDLEEKGQIYVKFNKRGSPAPVNVMENGGHVIPSEGDYVLVGFVDGDKTTPYLIGYAMNNYACANFFRLSAQGITLQFPLDETDAEEHMTDDTKESKRASIRIHSNSMELYYPVGGDAVKVTLTKDGVLDVAVPDSIKLGGETPVARQGDSVQVSVPGIGTCTGTITGGSDKVKVG